MDKYVSKTREPPCQIGRVVISVGTNIRQRPLKLTLLIDCDEVELIKLQWWGQLQRFAEFIFLLLLEIVDVHDFHKIWSVWQEKETITTVLYKQQQQQNTHLCFLSTVVWDI